MRQPSRFLALCLVLCMGVFGMSFAEEAVIAVISEAPLSFSNPPAYPEIAFFALPNRAIFASYDALHPETIAPGTQMGLDQMVEQTFAIFDEAGQCVWNQMYMEHEADNTAYYLMFEVQADSMKLYDFDDLSLDTYQWREWSLRGDVLGYSGRLTLADEEKRYVTNLPSWLVSIYPFTEENPIRMEIRHRGSDNVATYPLIYGEPFGFFEDHGRLIVVSADENGLPICRVFDEDAQMLRQLDAPWQGAAVSMLSDGRRLFFFTEDDYGQGTGSFYTLDQGACLWMSGPVAYQTANGERLTPIVCCPEGFVVALTDEASRDEQGQWCGLSALALLWQDGSLTPIENLERRIEWFYAWNDTEFSTITRDVESGSYWLTQYAVSANGLP